jgi:hypothetical protein
MPRFIVVACAFCIAAPGSTLAQSAKPRSAEQIADSIEIAQLARTLARGADTDSVRAARIYEWVARHLSYDVQGFLRGRLGDSNAESVYRKRLAVCGGYVALFERLARELGLETTPILGYAKGFTYRSGASTRKPNHSWLAVRIGEAWRLVDPTWASGWVRGTTFEPHFTWDYFLVDANELILSHFPEDDDWQLLRKEVRRSEFERLPLIPRTLVNAGFDPSMIRATSLAQGVRSFPLVGTRSDVRIVAAPLNGVLPRESKVSVDVIWPSGADVALVSGGIWRHLTREGDRFRGEAVATESLVSLVGRTDDSKDFETLLQYQVR